MAKKTELSKEMQAAIDNYGDRIETLQDFVTAVKLRYSMYLGAAHAPGFLHMIREIFQNSIDQLVDDRSPCDHIYIFYDMTGELKITVSDNGLGLPKDDMVRILTTQHTSQNYTKKKGEYSSGMNGVGAKVVNALSTYFIAESYRYDGQAFRLEMRDGYPTTEEPTPIPNPEYRQGTTITFSPSQEILGHIDLDWNIVYRLIKRIVSLTPLGSVVDFEAIDEHGVVHNEHIVNTDGILTDLITKAKNPFIKPIIVAEDNGEYKVEAAFVYSSDYLDDGGDTDAQITAFCNWCPTSAGTHIDGVRKGIEAWFVNYMNKIYLTSAKNKTKVIAADIDCGLCVFINAACLDADFSGQAKETLTNPEMEPFAKAAMMKALDNWAASNPQDLNKLCKYFKEIADIRIKSTEQKTKIVEKFDTSFTGMPAKYYKPEGKEHLELIICEGDSAKGTILNARDKKRQGVFPIRGKMPNAFRTPRNKFLNNAEVQSISKIILGKQYTKNFDPIKDVKWEKIIFGADADVDGGHICTLLLRFFLLYMPQLVEAGKVYKLIPPLYSTRKGNRETYYTDRIDMVMYNQREFAKCNTVSFSDGSNISPKELSIILAKNIDYVYEMNKVSKTFAIDPCLLEMILINHINKALPTSLKKQLKSSYKFLDMTQKKDIISIEGPVNGTTYDTIYMTDQLISECSNLIDILKDNKVTTFNLNGNNVPLYTLMKTFEDFGDGKNISRFKGLGEMDPQQIAESCLLPDKDRVLQQYTIQDIKDEIEAIREYESNMKLLLKDIGTVTRTELM